MAGASTVTKPSPGLLSEQRVWDVLTAFYDPELEVDIVNLGLVYGVEIREGDEVRVTMTLTSMGCPMQEEIQQDVMDAVFSIDAVEAVEVAWTFDPPWSADKVTEEGRDLLMSLGYL